MAGLPKVMLKKREELRAKNPEHMVTQDEPARVMIPIDVPAVKPANEGGDPPATSSVEEPVVVEKPIPLEEQYRITAEKWETKFRSLQGTVESLEPQLRSERDMRTRLENELQALREAMPKPEVKPDPTEELTEEELATYKDSTTVIQKIAKKIAKGELSAALKDIRKEVDDLKAATGRVESGVVQNEEKTFLDSVRRGVKNFDATIETQEWKDYLGKKLPYSRDTIYDALQSAHDRRDLDTILDIFKDFKPSKSALDAMRTPTLNGGGGSPQNLNGNQKPILKWSDRKRMSDDMKFGRIKTKEQKAEWDRWDAEFRLAEQEGRVDFNK